MKEIMHYFGIEIEFTVTIANILNLLSILESNDSILLASMNKDHGYLFRDNSITPDGIYDLGYEIKTKKLPVSEYNFDRVFTLLQDLNGIIKANDTCSMHLHLSRSGFSIKDHYMLLYEFLQQKHDKEFRRFKGVEMENFSYASYSDARRKYYTQVKRALDTNGVYFVDDMYTSKALLYTINTSYNTIEYRGARGHYSDKISLEDVWNLIKNVAYTFIDIKTMDLLDKYKGKFKYKI